MVLIRRKTGAWIQGWAICSSFTNSLCNGIQDIKDHIFGLYFNPQIFQAAHCRRKKQVPSDVLRQKKTRTYEYLFRAVRPYTVLHVHDGVESQPRWVLGGRRLWIICMGSYVCNVNTVDTQYSMCNVYGALCCRSAPRWNIWKVVGAGCHCPIHRAKLSYYFVIHLSTIHTSTQTIYLRWFCVSGTRVFPAGRGPLTLSTLSTLLQRQSLRPSRNITQYPTQSSGHSPDNLDNPCGFLTDGIPVLVAPCHYYVVGEVVAQFDSDFLNSSSVRNSFMHSITQTISTHQNLSIELYRLTSLLIIQGWMIKIKLKIKRTP